MGMQKIKFSFHVLFILLTMLMVCRILLNKRGTHLSENVSITKCHSKWGARSNIRLCYSHFLFLPGTDYLNWKPAHNLHKTFNFILINSTVLDVHN